MTSPEGNHDTLRADDTFVFGEENADPNTFLTHHGLYQSPLEEPFRELDLVDLMDVPEMEMPFNWGDLDLGQMENTANAETLGPFDMHLGQDAETPVEEEETKPKPKPEARVVPTRRRKQSFEENSPTKQRRKRKNKEKKELYYEMDSNCLNNVIDKKKIDKAKKSKAFRDKRNGELAFFKFAYKHLCDMIKQTNPDINIDEIVRGAFEAES